MDNNSNDDNNSNSKAKDSDSDNNSDSDSGKETDSKTDEQPDDDNKNGLIDGSYKGPDFKPEPYKLEAINEEDGGHGEILTYPDHQPNPTVVIE